MPHTTGPIPQTIIRRALEFDPGFLVEARCARHPGAKAAYAVCVHAIAGAVGHHCTPARGRPGEILCARRPHPITELAWRCKHCALEEFRGRLPH